MRDLTIGKPMEAHRHDKHHTKKGSLPPLLICWLVAVGLMMLVSSHGNTSPRTSIPTPQPTLSVQ